jgi:type 1 fimbria pilin
MSCLDGYIADTACTLEMDDQDWVCYSKTYTDDLGNVYSGRTQTRGDRSPMPGVKLPGPDSIAYRNECLRRARCNYRQTNPDDLSIKTVLWHAVVAAAKRHADYS